MSNTFVDVKTIGWMPDSAADVPAFILLDTGQTYSHVVGNATGQPKAMTSTVYFGADASEAISRQEVYPMRALEIDGSTLGLGR